MSNVHAISAMQLTQLIPLSVLQHIFKELFQVDDNDMVLSCYNIMLGIRDINIKDYIAMTMIYILRYKYAVYDISRDIHLTNMEIAIAAMILGAKMVVDQPYYYNEVFAKKAYLSTNKVCLNEIEFCKRIKFDFCISPEEYEIAHGIIDTVIRTTCVLTT